MENYGAAKVPSVRHAGPEGARCSISTTLRGMEQARRLAGSGLQVIGYTLNASNADAAPVNRAFAPTAS